MNIKEYKQAIKDYGLKDRFTEYQLAVIEDLCSSRFIQHDYVLSNYNQTINVCKNKHFRLFSSQLGKTTGITKKDKIRVFDEVFRDEAVDTTYMKKLYRNYEIDFSMDLSDKQDIALSIHKLINFCNTKGIVNNFKLNIYENCVNDTNAKLKDITGVLTIKALTNKYIENNVSQLNRFIEKQEIGYNFSTSLPNVKVNGRSVVLDMFIR